MKIVIPKVLAALLRLRRPHLGVGEKLAQNIVMQEVMGHGHKIVKDVHGNIEVQVGEQNGCVFTAHLDTVHREDGQQELFIIKDPSEGGAIEIVADGPDGKPSVLGSDDASGVYLLLEMIAANRPGMYLFFVGEECGGIGSSAYVKDHSTFSANMVVSFDRRGTKDIITHQGGYCTASNTFAMALGAAMNKLNPNFEYAPCAGGLYTDSREFAELVPECTNIAVGYYNEHTIRESQDLAHLLALRDVVVSLDWESLPIARVPEPDLPWQGWDIDTPSFSTRKEALGAIEALREAGLAGDLSDTELNHYLDIIEGYVK
jgi:hypothetical protein